MSPEKQRIAIAEACGWRFLKSVADRDPDTLRMFYLAGLPPGEEPPHAGEFSVVVEVPNYPTDLNAMHEAEKTFQTSLEKQSYTENLLFTMNTDPAGAGNWTECWDVCHASAAQRAEAFLRTIGKWEDGE